MPRATRLLLLWLSVWLGVLLPAVGGGAEPTNRPRAWATKIDRPGLPNLYKINDGLYRGAQPTPEGIGQLEKMGVKTIVGLRAEYSDKEILGGASLVLEQIPADPWNVNEEDLVRFLRIVTDKSRQPVFVHCRARGRSHRHDVRGVSRSGRRLDQAAGDRRNDQAAASSFHPVFAKGDVKIETQRGGKLV